MTRFKISITSRRRIAASLALVALLMLGMLRLAAFAQEEGDEPSPRGGGNSGGPKAAVFIDKERNALIQIDKQGTPGDGSSGTINAGTDLGGGLSTMNVDLNLGPNETAKMKGAKVSAYGQVDTSNTVVLGNLNIPLPPEAQQAKITGDAKIQQNDKNVHADIKVNAVVPNTKPADIPFTKLAVDWTNKTDYKTINGVLNVAVNAEALKQSPLKDLDLTIADPDPNTTTLDLNVTIDLNNPMSGQVKPMLEQIKANPKQFEDKVKSSLESFVKVESVSLKADINGNDGKLGLSVKATGLRAKLGEFVQNMVSRMPASGGSIDPNVVKQSADNMLAIQFNKLNLNVKIQNEALNSSFTVDAKNFDKFLAGYTALMSNVQEASFKEMQAKHGDDKAGAMALKWWHAVQTKANEMSSQIMTDMAASGVLVTQSLKLNVEVKDQITVDGSYVQDANNFEKVYQALKAKNMPVSDGGGLIAHVKSEGGAVTGSFFISAKGNVPKMLQAILVDPAKADPELKPAADMLSNLQWQDGRMQMNVNEGKITFQGYTKTSDLTPIVGAIQTVAMPSLTGTPSGARLESVGKDGKTNTTVRIGYKAFETGKSADDVKKAVSETMKIDDVTVNESADANQVALAKLDQPKIEMPAELASVKTEGETLVAAVPAPGTTSGGGAPGTPGGMNMGVLIGIGVAVLALLGIVMASGKKK